MKKEQLHAYDIKQRKRIVELCTEGVPHDQIINIAKQESREEYMSILKKDNPSTLASES